MKFSPRRVGAPDPPISMFMPDPPASDFSSGPQATRRAPLNIEIGRARGGAKLHLSFAEGWGRARHGAAPHLGPRATSRELRAPTGPLGGAPPSLGLDAVGRAPASASGRLGRRGTDGRRKSVDPSDGAQGAVQQNPPKRATGTFEPHQTKRAAEVPARSRPSARRELPISERLVTGAFGAPGFRTPATRRDPRPACDALATCPPRPMRAPAAARPGCADRAARPGEAEGPQRLGESGVRLLSLGGACAPAWRFSSCYSVAI